VFYGPPARTKGDGPQITPQKILAGLELNLVEALSRDPRASRAKVARELGISADTVKEYIDKLKKKGVVKRIGPDRGGYWEVTR
jgi:ATP-dependent DNA helicase RecG